jgi:carbon-monoxide dehydrogenase large subunit
MRAEDDRLVRGRGVFVDDHKWPGAAFATFVRSEHAHARVVNIRTAEAMVHDGVIEVITPSAWPELAWQMPMRVGVGSGNIPYNARLGGAPRPLLGSHVARVGEPVAVVLSTSPYIGADAAALIEVEYETLPVATWEGILNGDAPEAHPGYDNLVGEMRHSTGPVDENIANAEIVINKRLSFQSLKSMALECRGAFASWDRNSETLTVRSTNQSPYALRSALSQFLEIRIDQVRVVSGDIGGSFGLKGRLAPEEMIVALAAVKLGIPVRWTETRLEHMTSADQNGRQVHDVTVAATADGAITAIDLDIQKDGGAFNHFDVLLPSNTLNHLCTHYKIPAIRCEAKVFATNSSPGSPYRGAGRVEATFTMDRILDAVARAAGLDPLTVRERNIVQKSELPYRNGLIYRDGHPVEYRDLDFPLLLKTAVDRIDYWGWRKKQKELRADGRMIGIGISSYVEGGGIGPSETADVTLTTAGALEVSIGVNCMGQSHETTIAQVCANVLNIPSGLVRVRGGDTNLMPIGFGTNASRVAITVGNAAFLAASELLQRIKSFAAAVLGCEAQAVECVDGRVWCRADQGRTLTFTQLAQLALRHPAMARLGGPVIAARSAFYPRTVVWSSGVNIAVIEIDGSTGKPKILKYVFAHDCGNPIDLKVVDGQLLGGFAQGLGIALGEEHLYDDQGQVVTGSMMNYYVPRASDVPEIDIKHLVFPTEENPLGIKAVGESGPNSPPAAIAAAVEDALQGAIEITRLPVSWNAILLEMSNKRTPEAVS